MINLGVTETNSWQPGAGMKTDKTTGRIQYIWEVELDNATFYVATDERWQCDTAALKARDIMAKQFYVTGSLFKSVHAGSIITRLECLGMLHD